MLTNNAKIMSFNISLIINSFVINKYSNNPIIPNSPNILIKLPSTALPNLPGEPRKCPHLSRPI
jgi:hypothetical protein